MGDAQENEMLNTRNSEALQKKKTILPPGVEEEITGILPVRSVNKRSFYVNGRKINGIAEPVNRHQHNFHNHHHDPHPGITEKTP